MNQTGGRAVVSLDRTFSSIGTGAWAFIGSGPTGDPARGPGVLPLGQHFRRHREGVWAFIVSGPTGGPVHAQARPVSHPSFPSQEKSLEEWKKKAGPGMAGITSWRGPGPTGLSAGR